MVEIDDDIFGVGEMGVRDKVVGEVLGEVAAVGCGEYWLCDVCY